MINLSNLLFSAAILAKKAASEENSILENANVTSPDDLEE